jgi:ABC-2 type transport system permease protein
MNLRKPRGAWAEARKTLALARLLGAQQWAYPREILASSAFVLVTMYIFTNLWRTIGAHHDLAQMTGLKLPELIWYLAFTEAVYMSANSVPDGVAVDREVRTGDIAYRMVRPVGYASYHLTAYLGERLASFLLRLVVSAGGAWLLVGLPALAPAAIAASLVTVVTCFVADAVWTHAIAFLSFWVEDTYGLHLLYRRAVMLLGGVLIPLEAYPSWARDIAEALPFRLLISGPARLFVAPDAAGFGRLLLLQLGWAAAGLLPLLFIYRAGIRRVGAQGG